MIRPSTDQGALSSEETGDSYTLGRKCVRPHGMWGGNLFHLVVKSKGKFSELNLFPDATVPDERRLH